MLGYVTLGTNDLQKNAPFYDAIAKEMGFGRMMDFDTFIAWGNWEVAGVALTQPFDGKAASVGNGTMAALQASGPEQVQRIYDIAMANGGSDEGAPGPPDELPPAEVALERDRFLHRGAEGEELDADGHGQHRQGDGGSCRPRGGGGSCRSRGRGRRPSRGRTAPGPPRSSRSSAPARSRTGARRRPPSWPGGPPAAAGPGCRHRPPSGSTPTASTTRR